MRFLVQDTLIGSKENSKKVLSKSNPLPYITNGNTKSKKVITSA